MESLALHSYTQFQEFMKKLFIIDWTLVLCILLTAVTGVGMHVAGHGTGHVDWEIWAWSHSLSGMLFTGFAVWHVKMHLGWYKSLLRNKSAKNRHVTLALSVIALIAAATGLVMFAVSGANTGIGNWHYRIGILLSAFALGHILKRSAILRKSINC